jgi:hypothetical protein
LKKIVLFLCSAILSILMFLPAAGQVMADPGKNFEVKQTNRAELIIKAVNNADVGQPVTITVFTKQNHNTVGQAMVYVLMSSDITIPADVAHYSTASKNYTDTVLQSGSLIGLTDDNGNIEYQFQETGRYNIIAVKESFISGTAAIVISIAAEKGLIIRNPDTVKTGQTAVFKIVERDKNTPVDNAALYAMNIGDISAQEVIDSGAGQSSEIANIGEIKASGIFLGYSNNGGIVRFQFTESGNFIVVADKDNYAPGFTKISVESGNTDRLSIRAVDKAAVNTEVSIGVFDGSGQGVSDAGVYFLKIGPEFTSLSQMKNADKQQGIPLIAEVTDQASINEMLKAGNFIGNTNDRGQVSYIFDNSGVYVLIAVKDGYLPARHKISITLAETNSILIKVPSLAQVKEQVIITALDWGRGDVISGAAVYAMKWQNEVGKVQRNTFRLQNKAPVEPDPVMFLASSTNQTGGFGLNLAFPSVDEVAEKGILLGYTGDEGKVSCSFDETGRYVIVAVKDGYNAGFTNISIRYIEQNHLYIRVPSNAVVNEEVTISVLKRDGFMPVEEAAIYATKVILSPVSSTAVSVNGTADGIILQAEESATDNSTDDTTGRILLGYTDENGKVTYTFSETGRYRITAVKDGFVPGFDKINITGNMSDSLLLKVQDQAVVDTHVTMSTLNKDTLENVPDVDMYGYKIDGFVASVRMTFREAFSFGHRARENLAASVSKEGFYIGSTGESCSLDYSFTSEGRYLLIAFKTGFIPDFEKIEIKTQQTD